MFSYQTNSAVDPLEIVNRIASTAALDRPVIVNRIAYFNNLVQHPPRDPSMTPARDLNFRLYNARLLNLAREHLALFDRMHELLHLTEIVRALFSTPPAALAVCSDVWLTELLRVAEQYAALGPVGPDPGPL